MRAPLPANETQRLEVLRQCQILDTPPELEFDDPVQLAAQVCNTPVAWLALLDEDRAFLKARVQCPTAELPRESTPCAHTLLSDDLFIVSDLGADPRLTPLTIGERTLRFYAGAPLVTHDGCALGTLAVLDEAPQELDGTQQEALLALARQATLQLEWRRHAFGRFVPVRPVERENDEDEIALLPHDERFRNAFEHAVIGMALLGLNGHFLTVNPSLCGIVGYTAQELLATNFQAITHPDDLEYDLEQMRQMLEGEILSYEIERRLNLRRGGEAWVLLSVSLVRDNGGEPLYFLAQLQDITKRKNAESELQDAHEKLKAWVGELERRTTEMSLIGEMGELLQSCRSVSEAYKIMARTVRQLFPGMSGVLYAFNPEHDHAESVLSWGEVQTETLFAPDDCWGLRRNRMHVVKGSTFEGGESGNELVCPHMILEDGTLTGAYICLPLTAQRETLGLLHLMTGDAGQLSEDRQQLARTVAEQISLALANLHLQERLRNQSIRDPLTGLFNRRYLEESLERELNRAQRAKRPLGLIMLDIDFFKKFNDTHGHDAGDAVLREVAMMLCTHLRKADIACRYGGEEFTLILPDADAEAACQKAGQLREAARRLEIQYGRQIVGPISLSLGVACFPSHGASGETLLQAADAALYKSKAAGRDCVTLAELS